MKTQEWTIKADGIGFMKMTNSYAPIGWLYDSKCNLKPYHLSGKGKSYAPPGYDYNGKGELVRNGSARWYEVEIRQFETNTDWHYKPFRKKEGTK